MANLFDFDGMILLHMFVLVGIVMSVGYSLLVLRGARGFFFAREPDPSLGSSSPTVTILKPLKGPDPHLYGNLASLCTQRYPAPVQILCGVADADDPAVETVRLIQRDFPAVDIELVVDPRVYGSNHKISNLENLYGRAKHDILVIADSDIRVGPHYLRRIVPPAARPGTGLVTCLYRAVHEGDLPSLLESLFVNTDFCPMVLVAGQVEKASYAFGATIAMRREVLEEVGGFLPFSNELADDYRMGNRIRTLGYELILSREIVETVVSVPGWNDLRHHLVRWARTYRTCRGVGFFFTIFTHATLWAVLTPFVLGFSPATCLVGGGLLLLRLFSAAVLLGPCLKLHRPPADGPSPPQRFPVGYLRELAFLWFKDLLVSLVWLLAFTGNTVRWNDRRFRILENGEMLDLTPGTNGEEAMEEVSLRISPNRRS